MHNYSRSKIIVYENIECKGKDEFFVMKNYFYNEHIIIVGAFYSDIIFYQIALGSKRYISFYLSV